MTKPDPPPRKGVGLMTSTRKEFPGSNRSTPCVIFLVMYNNGDVKPRNYHGNWYLQLFHKHLFECIKAKNCWLEVFPPPPTTMGNVTNWSEVPALKKWHRDEILNFVD